MSAQPSPLSETRGYVGGGNIAGILGLSPFRSPLDEYLTITGSEQEISQAKRKFFDRRKALEPFACQCFETATGLTIQEVNHRYDDAKFPWAKAEIDAEVNEDGERVNVEFKTVHPNSAWQWGDPEEGEEPPAYVTAQVMWGLGVTGRNRAYVNGLDLDRDRIYVVERDDALITEIRARAANFWKWHVEPRRAPQPTTADDLLRLYARDSGRAIEATEEVAVAMEQLDIVKRAINGQEAQRTLLEFAIKNHMRDATTLTIGGRAVATWKASKNGTRRFVTK